MDSTGHIRRSLRGLLVACLVVVYGAFISFPVYAHMGIDPCGDKAYFIDTQTLESVQGVIDLSVAAPNARSVHLELNNQTIGAARKVTESQWLMLWDTNYAEPGGPYHLSASVRSADSTCEVSAPTQTYITNDTQQTFGAELIPATDTVSANDSVEIRLSVDAVSHDEESRITDYADTAWLVNGAGAITDRRSDGVTYRVGSIPETERLRGTVSYGGYSTQVSVEVSVVRPGDGISRSLLVGIAVFVVTVGAGWLMRTLL